MGVNPMRITSGLFKSRIIKGPKHIRPTQEKVRKALFDTLGPEVVDSFFLELFAGSGAVGIEALSNAAKDVVFVEGDKRCCKIIEDNLLQLGLISTERARGKNIFTPFESKPLRGLIFAIDALKAVEIFYRKNKKFDIIFLDPPYYGELARKTLQKISACDILAPRGLVIVEHNKRDFIDKDTCSLTSFKQKIYGDTILSFYQKEVIAL